MPKISLKRWVKRNPAVFASTLLIVLLAGGLLAYKIGSLLPNANKYEVEAILRLDSFSDVFARPFDFIYYGLAKLISFIISDLTSLRLTSVFFALLCLLNIRSIIRYWYDSRIANIGALILATSAWFLTIGRTGYPLIMPAFWLSALLNLITWQRYTPKKKTANILIITCASLGIYSPGFIWWLLAVCIVLIYIKGPKNIVTNLNNPLIAIPLILAIPLVMSCFKIDNAKELLGAYGAIKNPLSLVESITRYMSQIIFKGVADPAINLGRLPYLDIFQTIMLALGLTILYPNRKSLRGALIIGASTVYIVLVSAFIFNQTKLIALMPIIFIVISIGLNEFITLWLKGFPRNPIGRSLGILLSIGLISLSGYYNVHRYYVAWAQNPDVKAAHQLDR